METRDNSVGRRSFLRLAGGAVVALSACNSSPKAEEEAPVSVKFPKGFLWGSATSAHQVEGNNVNSDMWMLEHLPGTIFAEPSGDASDQYHRYREDIALLAKLGQNAYRFSIEWARVEPEEGCFSRAELEHYRRVAATCREHGITPFVTFHHFTFPRWVACRGGWEVEATADLFARYCERATKHLGDLLGGACTINELNVMILLQESGFQLSGAATPTFAEAIQKACGSGRFSSFFTGDVVKSRDTLLAAHRRAREAIKSGPGDFPVGLTISMQDEQAVNGGEARRDQLRAKCYDVFLEAARKDDFVGVQTYTRGRVGPDGPLGPEEGVELTQMGYEFWPKALEQTIRYAVSVANVPVIVTENGIGTEDDTRRVEYIERALRSVGRCLDDGLDVRGYFYWSALDNFEWVFGYLPKFGLIAVDRETQKRTAKPSAYRFAKIARANHLA